MLEYSELKWNSPSQLRTSKFYGMDPAERRTLVVVTTVEVDALGTTVEVGAAGSIVVEATAGPEVRTEFTVVVVGSAPGAESNGSVDPLHAEAASVTVIKTDNPPRLTIHTS